MVVSLRRDEYLTVQVANLNLVHVRNLHLSAFVRVFRLILVTTNTHHCKVLE